MALQGVRSVSSFFLIVATVSLFVAVPTSFAGKDHCRTLKLDGTAGETSTDSVVFQLVDINGGFIIDRSCQVTVKKNEKAADFGRRLPVQWFFGEPELPNGQQPISPPCLTDTEALTLATKPNGKIKFPKKICSQSISDSGPSCRIKFTHKVKKSTGITKKGPLLDICCWETPGCKGTKWGTTMGQPLEESNPINLQVSNNSVSINFLPVPAKLPAEQGAISDLVVDPIGLEQLPVPEIQKCRQAVALDVEKFTSKVYSVLQACHTDESVVDQSVCNTVNSASDPDDVVAEAEANLRQEISDACASLGSPTKLSYTECPDPCRDDPDPDTDLPMITGPQCVGGPHDGLTCRTDAECDSGKRCSAGTLGSACTDDVDCSVSGVCLGAGFCPGPICTVDADCDTVPGNGKCVRKGDGVCQDRCTEPVASAGTPCGVDADCDVAPGDGRCGDWDEVGNCAACLAQTSDESAMLAMFGPSGSTIRSSAGGARGLSSDAAQCKLFLVQSMGQLQKLELKETRTCQKLLDSGKITLPADAKKCKDADRKGKRAKAIASIQNTLQSATGCVSASVIAELDSCGADPTSLGTCAVDAIKDVNQAYGVAAIPDSRCGDGKRIGEQCDDGNTAAGDGCAADCTCEGICGDGILNPLPVCGELCDDGNIIDGDGCDTNCTPTGCGNGIITAGEQCEADSDCSAGLPCTSCSCGTSAVCGDGVVQPAIGEECDDGDLINGDGCDSNCKIEACGNGIIQTGEQCDDGNASNADLCLNNCTLAACGDGFVQAVVGEECDDGNVNDNDVCLSDCSLAICGDGVVCADPNCTTGLAGGPEDCDGGDDGNCPGLCQLDCGCGLSLAVFGDLSPCDPSVLDRYQFSIGVGETIVVTADTTDLATASDLCFDVFSDCDTSDTLLGDDDIPCTFPSPFGFDCPQDVFVASDNGTCIVEVTECASDCADVSRANYVLTLTRNGIPAPLTLLNDNEPN